MRYLVRFLGSRLDNIPTHTVVVSKEEFDKIKSYFNGSWKPATVEEDSAFDSFFYEQVAGRMDTRKRKDDILFEVD